MILKKILVFIILLVVIIGGFIFWQKINGSALSQQISSTDNKEYRVEAGKVKVIDSQSKKEIATIDLSAKEDDFTINFIPHALTQNRKYVWVTASASQEQLSALHKNAKEHMHLMMTSDQLILIDSSSNSIKARVQIGNNIRLSDIVLSSDSKYVYISAEAGNVIYKVNASNFKVEQMIQLPPESFPHEIALSEDASKIFTRNSEGDDVFIISAKTNKFISKVNADDASIKNVLWSKH